MVDGVDRGEPRAAGDPLSEFAAAMNNVWSMGSVLFGRMLTQPEMARAAAAMAPFMTASRQLTSPAEHADSGTALDAAGCMAQTCLVAAGSGLRYWRRLAEVNAAHQASLLQAMASGEPMGELERRTLADRLRGYMRELGDISLQEARLFQLELERLSDAFAVATDPGATDATPHRRWRAKP